MTSTVKIEYHTEGVFDDTLPINPYGVGAARCGLRFNPDENHDVRRIKTLAAALMQELENYKNSREADDGDGKRCFATAMTELESAQMFAVRGLFARRNAGKE